MIAGVVNAHDLALDVDRVRDINHVGEYVCQAHRYGGFAIAGRSIEKDGPARVQRRSALFDDAVLEGKGAKGFPYEIERDPFVGNLLQVDLGGEFFQGNGRGSGISRLIEGVEYPASTRIGDRIAHIARVSGIARSESMHQLTVDGHLDQCEHDVIRELDGIDELADGFKMFYVNELHQQAQQFRRVDFDGR